MKSVNINSAPQEIIPNKSSVENGNDKKRTIETGINIFTINNLLLGLLISLTWHIIFVSFIHNFGPLQTVEFWFLFLIDTILQGISIVPLIAIIRRQIAWYDPVCLLSIMFIFMTAGFLPAYLADPAYYFSFITLQGEAKLGINSESNFFLAASYAEIIYIVFIVIVYFINRRTIRVSSVRTNVREIKSVLFFTMILFFISLFFFSQIWDFQSYLRAITVDIGSYSVKSPAIGSAYKYILADIGIPSLSLGMIALLISNSIKGRIPRIILIGSVILITLIHLIM